MLKKAKPVIQRPAKQPDFVCGVSIAIPLQQKCT